MRPSVLFLFALTACTSGSVKINDGDDDVYDANDHKENEPPGAPEVNLTPSGADTRDDLEAEILFEASDADGDHLTYDYVWLVDGDLRADLSGATLSADETDKGDRWEVRVRAYDGREYGPVASDSVDIGNAPPTLQIRWKNEAPTTDDNLVVKSNKDDPDGDVVDLTYVWTVDGNPTPFVTDTVLAEATSGGELWAVTVEATDEEGDSVDEALDVTIFNRPPVIADLAITPNPAPPSAALRVAGTVTDPDGDSVVTTYAWTVDGTATSFVAATIPASATEDGQTWQVTVTADDQHGGVTIDQASVDVINHPPTLTTVSISPSPPGDSAFLSAEDDGADADGDLLTYTYVWYRNGVVFPGSTSSFVSPSSTTIGDTWQVSVSISDGSATVGPVLSAIETIQNVPPTTPVVAFNPAVPNTCNALQCVVLTASYDPDGTSVTQTVSWQRNGTNYTGTRNTTTLTNDTIPVSALVPGDVWTCKVTGSSGGQSGLPGQISDTVLDSSATETFTVNARTQADILLMVDNSCSMTDPQTKFSTAASTLLTTLDGIGLSYHVGVVTSDMDDAAQSGHMVVGPLGDVYVSPSVVTRQSVLSSMINVGINGSAYEAGLDSTKAALTSPLWNPGFLRASGGLAILFLTDEPDQSASVTSTSYVTWLRTLRSDSNLTLWGIVGDPVNGCSSSTAFASSADGYHEAIRALNGSWSSICDVSYTNSVRDFANAAAGLSRRFTLAQDADVGTMSVVKIAPGGARTTLSYGAGYTYDAVTHAVLLTATPVTGTSYEVSYDVTCPVVAAAASFDTGL